MRRPAPAARVSVRDVASQDRDDWADLFGRYRDFYRLAADEAVVETVWNWLCDGTSEVRGLVAVVDGELIGFAHYRKFARPASGTVGLWLDDLFVAANARGTGAGRALLEHLRGVAAENGLSVMRWLTAENNTAARRTYDALARATTWVVYDADPEIGGT